MIALVLAASAAAPPLPACSTSTDPEQVEASAALKALHEQAAAASGDPKTRLKALKKLDKHICTADDHLHAGWVLLGSQDADDLERAYELGQLAAYHHAKQAKELVVRAYDRWQVALGAPQRYGTATGAGCFHEVEEGFTDAQRAQWGGAPLEQHLRAFLDAQGHPTEPATLTTLLRLQLLCPRAEK